MGVGGRDRFVRLCRGAGTASVVPPSSRMVGAARSGGDDRTLTVSSCTRRYLGRDKDPGAGGDHNRLPWRRGLFTGTGSTR